MTLQNLLKIGRLKPHEASAAEVQRLLAAIRRNLADAAVPNISDETRFDVAYKAVMPPPRRLRSASRRRGLWSGC